MSATAQESPPRIDFTWVGDPTAPEYLIYRKSEGDTAWTGPLAILPGTATSWSDLDVSVGDAYEYAFRKTRGIIRDTVAVSTGDSLTFTIRDSWGDGVCCENGLGMYQVSECGLDPTITTLLLLGHIPVPYSGLVKGAHMDHWGAWPADLYYGELDGEWTDSAVNYTASARPENRNVPGDGKFDQTFLPSDVDLQVGRVDLSRLPAFSQDEVTLLRRYLDRNHAFRTGDVAMPRRGLIDDNAGELFGTAYACTGWRNFTAAFGPMSAFAGDWIPTLQQEGYLAAYGCGPSGFTTCGGVASTTDFAARSFESVFTMLMGSYCGDWDNPDNVLRAPLASEGRVLTCCWAGRPPWHMHHMALGRPDTARVSPGTTGPSTRWAMEAGRSTRPSWEIRRRGCFPSGALSAWTWTACRRGACGSHGLRRPAPFSATACTARTV